MDGGEDDTRVDGFMASKGERALTALVIFGFLGYLVFGQNGAIVGAVIGALVGYFWK
jgi:hypothetical protein